MRIALIFILVSLILPASGFAKDDLFTDVELETLDKKLDSLSADWGGEKSMFPSS